MWDVARDHACLGLNAPGVRSHQHAARLHTNAARLHSFHGQQGLSAPCTAAVAAESDWKGFVGLQSPQMAE